MAPMRDDDVEQERQAEQVREAERERAVDHTPAFDVERHLQHARAALVPLGELPANKTWGLGLWARVRDPDDPWWQELASERRRAWAQAERFLAHKERQAGRPGPLRVELEAGEPVENYERHVEAVMAAVARGLRHAGLPEWWVEGSHSEEWLRGLAESVLAAAETGI